MPAEGRGLGSRRTQDAVRDRGIGRPINSGRVEVWRGDCRSNISVPAAGRERQPLQLRRNAPALLMKGAAMMEPSYIIESNIRRYRKLLTDQSTLEKGCDRRWLNCLPRRWRNCRSLGKKSGSVRVQAGRTLLHSDSRTTFTAPASSSLGRLRVSPCGHPLASLRVCNRRCDHGRAEAVPAHGLPDQRQLARGHYPPVVGRPRMASLAMARHQSPCRPHLALSR